MEWPLLFKDKISIEKSVIYNDGNNLTTVLRGTMFKGTDFDALKPDENADSQLLEYFTFSHGYLCNCILECYIEMPVCDNEQIVNGRLKAVLILGGPKESGALDKESLTLTLYFKDEMIASSGLTGYFEDELLEIQRKLPNGVYMKACINCLYSDYSPYGSGLFGTMMCFSNLKEEYLKVKSKDDFWGIHDRYDSLVQETYCCEEFKQRIPGTGYRG